MSPMPVDPLQDEPVDEPNPDLEREKIPQEEVAYGSPPLRSPNKTCERCAFFEGAFRCKIVRGDIKSKGWCVEWTDGFRNVQSRGPTPELAASPQLETTTAMSVGTAPEVPLGWKHKLFLRRRKRG